MKKIPDHATRVFKGVMFEVWQWQQEMFDGTTETFEALRRTPSTEVILVDGDEIILGDQEQPMAGHFMSLFGGLIEPGEDPLAAAKRELLEESGYEADTWELLETIDFPWNKMESASYLYVARNARKVAEQKLDSGERITIKRVSFDEFLQLAANGLRWAPATRLITPTLDQAGIDWLRQTLFGSTNN